MSPSHDRSTSRRFALGRLALSLGVALLWCAACGDSSSPSPDSGAPASAGAESSGGENVGPLCAPGDTRECVGPGACHGGELCSAARTWSACDCGSDSNSTAGGGGRQGNAGMSGGESNASMGGSSAAGAAGAPEPDACLGVMCNKPPASSCDSAQQFKTYDTVGTCAAGKCSYSEHLIVCSCQGGKCGTDPCIGVTCASPPDPNCKDPDTLTKYATSGICSAGACSYTPKDTTCAYGCANGACKPDPCAAVTCNAPPAAQCKDAATKTTYAATGTCSAGQCSYTPTDTACGSNQTCSGAGVCAVCKTNASCGASCAACSGGTSKCKDLGTTSKCVGCLSSADCSGDTPNCNPTTNVCQASPSCAGLAKTCGPAGTADCCASGLVTGGTVNRGNDANYPATVANFRLDNYEITVGRFRKFVAAYSQGMIAAGAGKNPNNASDTGWDTAWNTSLPATGMLTSVIKCDATYQSWTDAAGTAAAESLPINCIDWFEAEAFCIWDGGRLPTEAEWNYAAAGGTAQRTYPWGTATPSCSYANYEGAVSAGGYTLCVSAGTNRVGSESIGDGIFGQSDLAGNVWEWVQDWYADPYPTPCNNCANSATSSYRVIRGGSFHDPAVNLLSSNHDGFSPSGHLSSDGARCARTP